MGGRLGAARLRRPAPVFSECGFVVVGCTRCVVLLTTATVLAPSRSPHVERDGLMLDVRRRIDLQLPAKDCGMRFTRQQTGAHAISTLCPAEFGSVFRSSEVPL